MISNNSTKVNQSIIAHANNIVKDDIESNFENNISGKIYSQAYEISQEDKAIGRTFGKTGSLTNKLNDIDESVYDKNDELSTLEEEEI